MTATETRKSGEELLLERFPDAVRLWQRNGLREDGFTLTGFLIDGRVVVLQQFTDHRAGSWDVYLPASDSNRVDETLDAIAQPTACCTKKCSYYQHYLAYGPADLTHEGYHAAERICAERQQMATDFFDRHPNALELPAGLKHLVEAAEARVRA